MMRFGYFCRNKTTIATIKNKFVLPERFKGTVIEKWSNYWRSLYGDYKGMIVDLKVDMQEKPRKALIVLSSLGVVFGLARNNPSELDFQEDMKRYSNQLILVGESCQNPNTVGHFKSIEMYQNQGVLRRSSIGIASIMWVDDYSENCDLYKAKCSYLEPSYFSIPQRIVDVGIAGKWWNIYKKFQNFDVNV